jgi:hypothetical protein
MATHQVNLDALIQREDFESGPQAKGEIKEMKFTVSQLIRTNPIFDALRKPTFQRETNNWSAKMIVEFVCSFLDGDLIPAIILWKSETTRRMFLIDGSHRVSALVAWINDDYGDGAISRAFWGTVPAAQATLHRKTQELVQEKIGTFESLCKANIPGAQLSEQMQLRTFNLNTLPLPIQSVDGEAEVAEKSFLKINANPATIDNNELAIIRARTKPNTIATRALMRAGTGYPYWGKLPNATEIGDLASETSGLLFGQIVDIGTRVADVPRAGQPYSAEAFTMLLDMVNIFNNITPSMWQQPSSISTRKKPPQQTVTPLADDVDGSQTYKFIKRVQDVAKVAMSPETADGSLGLDQVVYSYGANGQFYPTAFIASLKFANELDDHKRYSFLKIRVPFEEFLVEHKSFIKDIGHSKGSRLKGLATFIRMYTMLFDALVSGTRDDTELTGLLLAETDLKLKEPKLALPAPTKRKTFGKRAKAAAAVREALETHGKCKICGARLPFYARSQDHKIDKSKGGTGTADNLQYTHPYCNSVKSKLEAEGWAL